VPQASSGKTSTAANRVPGFAAAALLAAASHLQPAYINSGLVDQAANFVAARL
jgi:hypothetical protein